MSQKNGVWKNSGLDFGGLGPRFWSLRASILEVPGPTCRTKETHFGAFKFKRPKMQTLGLGFGRLRASILKARAWAFKKCNSFKNPTDYRRGRCSKVGRRRWSPNGGFNPPPTVGVATACWTTVLQLEHRLQTNFEISIGNSICSV